MNHDDVQGWLDRYGACWLSYDEAAIGELFSEDAEYRYQPWGKPRDRSEERRDERGGATCPV
jgi:hypothetical protein